jgi:ubiquinone/menaquinone biosynthesis C-methylase UbiE
MLRWFRRGRGADSATSAVEGRRDAPSGVQWMGGRRHVADVPYALPNDLQEMNRLDFQHFFLRQAFRADYLAPIGQPRDVLDVGTGTGRWAVELAQRFPQANVIGLDITEPPGDTGTQQERRPENYVFVKGNLLEGLPFADQSFDFVHMRLLFSAIPNERWPWVVSELVRVTRPGGWVESLEATALQGGTPAMQTLARYFTEMLRRRGIDNTVALRLPDLMRQVGLVRVTTREALLPMGKPGGRIGQMLATDGIALMGAMRGGVVAAGLTTPEAYDALTAQITQDFETATAIQPNYITYGQRPR